MRTKYQSNRRYDKNKIDNEKENTVNKNYNEIKCFNYADKIKGKKCFKVHISKKCQSSKKQF